MVWRARCDVCKRPVGNPACEACRDRSAPPQSALADVPGSGPVQRERRNLASQAPIFGGQRTSDPRLTTRDCAERLGVTVRFIIGEIADGRLTAHVRQREGLRTRYRVSEGDFAAYLARHWPTTAGRPQRP